MSQHSIGGVSILVPRFRGETVGQATVEHLLSARSYGSHPDLLSMKQDGNDIGSGSPPSSLLMEPNEQSRPNRSQSVPITNTSPTAVAVMVPPIMDYDLNANNEQLQIGALNPYTGGLYGGAAVDDGTSSGAPEYAMAPQRGSELRVSVSLPTAPTIAPVVAGTVDHDTRTFNATHNDPVNSYNKDNDNNNNNNNNDNSDSNSTKDQLIVPLVVAAPTPTPSTPSVTTSSESDSSRISGIGSAGVGVGASSETSISSGSSGGVSSVISEDRRSIMHSRTSSISIDLKIDVPNSMATPPHENGIALTQIGSKTPTQGAVNPNDATPLALAPPAVAAPPPAAGTTTGATAITTATTTGAPPMTETVSIVPIHSRATSRSSGIEFSKEAVPATRGTIMLSPLGTALKNIKSGYAPAGFRCTVYLPVKLAGVNADGEPEFVQIEVNHSCVARALVREAIAAFRRAPPKGAKLPPNDSKLWDANLYRVYAAEDDGSIDTDFPAIDDNCKVDSTGVDAFALQMKGHNRSSSSSGDENTMTLGGVRGPSSSMTSVPAAAVTVNTSSTPSSSSSLPVKLSPKEIRRDSDSGAEAPMVRSSSAPGSPRPLTWWERICCCYTTPSGTLTNGSTGGSGHDDLSSLSSHSANDSHRSSISSASSPPR